jgi:hypothetical protein
LIRTTKQTWLLVIVFFVSRSKTGFIGKNDGEHIRGTECDQKILSKKESNGTIYSPNYPFLYHTNIVCKYFIYGLQDAQHLETVKLEFDKFEIPTTDPNECNDAYLRIYLSGESFDEPDQIVCGSDVPSSLVSDGPILILIFSSGTSQGQGFKGRYHFETDYKVSGTPDPPGCRFKYLSESLKAADFNSPRHPANYPSMTDCTYEFFAQPEEQVKIVFNYFKLKTSTDLMGYNDVCTEDWIEVYQVFPSGREYKFGRYCSATAPGPIVSDIGVNVMKVILSTDESGVASGFSAGYQFLTAMTALGDCGQNFTHQENGVITSPGYPSPYPPVRQICNWFVTVRPKYKVLLFFEFFLIEGDPASRGCPGAVVRVWNDLSSPPTELCGEGLANETREFISSNEMMRISFITADKAVGSGGFKATWTEIQDPSPLPVPSSSSSSPPASLPCDHKFKCIHNHYCISPQLKCNGINNCGKFDDSDEANCVMARENDVVMIALFSSGCLFFLLIVCCFCRKKRNRKRTASEGSVVFPGPERAGQTNCGRRDSPDICESPSFHSPFDSHMTGLPPASMMHHSHHDSPVVVYFPTTKAGGRMMPAEMDPKETQMTRNDSPRDLSRDILSRPYSEHMYM